VTPRFYLRILVEMEDLINATWEDSFGRKNMFKVNGKSLGALRQKLRKYLHEKHDDNIAKFEDEGSDDDGDFRAKSEEKEIAPRKAKKIPPDGEDDESDDWMSDSELQTTSDMFLKKSVDPLKEARRLKRKKRRPGREKRGRRKESRSKLQMVILMMKVMMEAGRWWTELQPKLLCLPRMLRSPVIWSSRSWRRSWLLEARRRLTGRSD
jgi:translation initiation factor 3 subunit C